jgi:hypothetical protein
MHGDGDRAHRVENKKDWKRLLKEFWKEFSPTLAIAEKEAFVPKVMTDLLCPKCQSPLQKIWSKSKYFYGCSRYPECTFSAPVEELSFNKEDYAADFDWDQFEDDQNTLKLGSFLVIDLLFSRPITRHSELYLGVENLLNSSYSVARTSDGVTSIGAPRLVRGGLRLMF